MRIAIDIKAFKNGTTGIVRYLTNMMDCLQKLDHDNDYFLFECGESAYAVHNPRWRKIRVPHQLTGVVWQQVLLPYYLRRYPVDVLWAPEQTCPLLRLSNARVVTTIHDLVFVHYPETCRFRTRVVFSLFSRFAIRRSDTVVTLSEFIKRDIIGTFGYPNLGSRIHAIPCGKPEWELPALYKATNRQDYLFFAGNLEPRKNLVNLVEALGILREKGLRIPLRIAGPEGWKNSKLTRLLEQNPVRDQISYLGFLPETELKEEYLNCKAFIYPSIYEGFGIPILEALCLDCLVLTSRGTVMQEIAGQAAAYFDPHRIPEIAAAIEAVYAGEVTRTPQQQECRARVLGSYSWGDAARSLLILLTAGG